MSSQNQAVDLVCQTSLPCLYPRAGFWLVCLFLFFVFGLCNPQSLLVQNTRLTVGTDAGNCLLQKGLLQACGLTVKKTQLKFTMWSAEHDLTKVTKIESRRREVGVVAQAYHPSAEAEAGG